MKGLSIGCHRHQANLGLLASGALPERDQPAVREHLKNCEVCAAHYAELSRIASGFKTWAAASPEVSLNAAFAARWQRSILAGRDSREAVSLATLVRRWLWPSPVAWSALAAVWIALLCLHRLDQPAQRSVSYTVASVGSSQPISLVERRRELIAVLDTMAAQPARKEDVPRPRSEAPSQRVTA